MEELTPNIAIDTYSQIRYCSAKRGGRNAIGVSGFRCICVILSEAIMVILDPLEDVARRGDKNHWLQDGLSFIEIQVICKRSPNDDGAHTSASVDRD